MSKRPEHVRCENCCYWEELPDHIMGMGDCARYPVTLTGGIMTHGMCAGDFRCGEFRSEWPEETE